MISATAFLFQATSARFAVRAGSSRNSMQVRECQPHCHARRCNRRRNRRCARPLSDCGRSLQAVIRYAVPPLDYMNPYVRDRQVPRIQVCEGGFCYQLRSGGRGILIGRIFIKQQITRRTTPHVLTVIFGGRYIKSGFPSGHDGKRRLAR